MTGSSELVLFFGRFHPLLVHLPIGVIVLLVFLEVLARSPRHRSANTAAGYLLGLGVPLSVLTAILGLLLSTDGSYEPRLVTWHLWTGVATAVLCCAAALLYKMELRKAYRICLVATFAVLLVASHFGGSLTHGSDYLVRYAPGPIRSVLGSKRGPAVTTVNRSVAEPPAFTAIVLPIFEKNCVACHGPEKSKGKLRLDSHEFVMRGGDQGRVVVPGNAAESELVKRIRLPLEDEDHMPPDGKPQPSRDEVTLLVWWIDTGASSNAPASSLQRTPEIDRILGAPSGQATPATNGAFAMSRLSVPSNSLR